MSFAATVQAQYAATIQYRSVKFTTLTDDQSGGYRQSPISSLRCKEHRGNTARSRPGQLVGDLYRDCHGRTNLRERIPTHGGARYATRIPCSLGDSDGSLRTTRRRNSRDQSPLCYLTVYDAPHELPDSAITHRLSPFCDVISFRRGKHAADRGVSNGLRHYRVLIKAAIPSFLRFGKFLVRLYHDGQKPTCWKCNRANHLAAQCDNIVCFNCERLGHMAHDCVKPMYCCICKSGDHLARTCPFSLHRAPSRSPSSEIISSSDPRPGEEVPAEENLINLDEAASVLNDPPTVTPAVEDTPADVSTPADPPPARADDPPASFSTL
ncbi:zinc finger protein [Desmophyllum pertusum]|uniref:Zinc finger protein n=1 Tax=Desmophyllum pertusum TaxID=174260 RepID=A0A9W9YNM9_9CNID|nr:zinc finger protein [Desmophyllum pertusum]